MPLHRLSFLQPLALRLSPIPFSSYRFLSSLSLQNLTPPPSEPHFDPHPDSHSYAETNTDPEAEPDTENTQETIVAIDRPSSGKIICKKERKEGRCPSIVYEQRDGHLGGHKRLLSVDSGQILRLVNKYGRSFFLSRTFDLDIFSEGINGEEIVTRERVLPRQLHLHAGNDSLLNVTFLRAPPNERLKVDIPLMFVGEDACVGIRKGGFLNTIRRTVRYECPASSIPPFIEVDLTNLKVGQKILLRDLPVSSDLKLVLKDASLPVCKIGGSSSLAQE